MIRVVHYRKTRSVSRCNQIVPVFLQSTCFYWSRQINQQQTFITVYFIHSVIYLFILTFIHSLTFIQRLRRIKDVYITGPLTIASDYKQHNQILVDFANNDMFCIDRNSEFYAHFYRASA